MNREEMLTYNDKHKRSVIAIMNIIANTKGSCNIRGTDPILYYKTLEDTIMKDMENDEDIQKDSRLYRLIEKYLPALVYGDIYFGNSNISHSISADMLYNIDNKDSYSRITLCCNISVKIHDEPVYGNPDKFTSIEIFPSLKLSYKNITTTCESNPIYVKDNSSSYSFYQIYINTKKSLRDLIENNYDMENSIADIVDIGYLLQEMAMIITLFYMKSIVPTDDYSKFIKLNEKKEDMSSEDTNLELKHYSEIGRDIFNIESSLYEIGSIDLDLLKDTLKKINSIVDESKSRIK